MKNCICINTESLSLYWNFPQIQWKAFTWWYPPFFTPGRMFSLSLDWMRGKVSSVQSCTEQSKWPISHVKGEWAGAAECPWHGWSPGSTLVAVSLTCSLTCPAPAPGVVLWHPRWISAFWSHYTTPLRSRAAVCTQGAWSFLWVALELIVAWTSAFSLQDSLLRMKPAP